MAGVSSHAASVLVVEDDDDVRTTVRYALEQAGYQVHEARNGQEALSFLHQPGQLPNLVLLDMMMPTLSGGEFLQSVGRDARLASLPVIIMSASPRPPAAALPPSVREVLQKPFSRAMLLSSVRATCPP